MSRQYDNRLLSFRKFDKIDGNTHVVYEFAWPVEVVECYANKVSNGVLNALAEATLELLTVPETSKKKIASLLLISEEVVNAIINELSTQGYYSSEDKQVTENGRNYIEKKEIGEFQEEKVFGNVFVSMIDREVFPYFYEGKLPWPQRRDNISYLSYDEENRDVIKSGTMLADKINRAYHNYGKISRSSKERETGYDKKIIEFIEEELHDRSYSEEMTLADVEEQRNLKNARIKILNTERRKIYIKTRFCVSKAAPEKFIVDSPFEGHITSWYSECFNRMREANELIYDIEKSEETGLDFLCDGITTQFYVDYPEMQGSNFDQYVKIHFPNMKSVKNASVFLDKYKEVFNLNLLCDEKGTIKRHTVLTESAKALETILNTYIHSTKKNVTVAKYEGGVATSQDIDDMLMNFDIKECAAQRKEKYCLDRNGRIIRRQSIMNSFRGDKDGKTIIEKYYFLVADANYEAESNFRRLLLKEGTDIISKLDYINEKRNKFGAHSDGIIPKQISHDEYSVFQQYFVQASKLLIDNLN